MDLKIFVLGLFSIGLAVGFPPDCVYPKFPVSPLKCCNLPPVISQQDFQVCLDEVMRSSPSGGPRPPPGAPAMQQPEGTSGGPAGEFMMKGCCVSECLLKKYGIVSSTNAIDASVAIKKLSTNMQEPWNKIVQEGINFCVDEVKKLDASGNFTRWAAAAPNNPEKICHPVSGFFIGCVTGRMYKSCPSPNLKDTELGCKDVNNFVDKCGYILPFDAPN